MELVLAWLGLTILKLILADFGSWLGLALADLAWLVAWLGFGWLLSLSLFLFREREGEKEREGERHFGEPKCIGRNLKNDPKSR